MEITGEQKRIILENLQKLSALGCAVGHLCEAGTPPDDVMCGWQLLLLDIEAAIRQIIEPKTTGK